MISLAPADAGGVSRWEGWGSTSEGSASPGPGGSMAGPGQGRGHRRAHWPLAFGPYYPWTLIGQETLGPKSLIGQRKLEIVTLVPDWPVPLGYFWSQGSDWPVTLDLKGVQSLLDKEISFPVAPRL